MGADEGDPTRPGGFDLARLASSARPREVTSVTFSYVDAMLTGRMSEADLERIRQDLLGESAAQTASTQAPVARAPGAQGGVAQAPVAQAFVAQAPVAQPRVTQAGVAQAFVAQAPVAQAPRVDRAMAHIESLMASRDHAGALRDAEAILTRDPTHAAALRAAEQCRHHLADLYLSHLGTGFDIPRLGVPVESLGAYGIDRWGAYLISRFDDHVTVDDLVHLTGYSRLDTFRLLYDLLHRGIVALERMTPPPAAPPSAPRVQPGGAATPAAVVAVARVKLKSIPG